jgi:heme oxygenase
MLRGLQRRTSMTPSWTLGHLAQQTQQHHAAADGDRLSILDTPTVGPYRRYLAQIYCFEAPIERACIATDGIPNGLLRTHLKTARLAADLDALGFDMYDAVPREPPRFEDRLDALAWLWVLHRNTLLHGLVYRSLRDTLGAQVIAGGSYLCAFESRAGALMRELGEVLDAAANRVSAAERIVASAKNAFRVQRQWYSCERLATRAPVAHAA